MPAIFAGSTCRRFSGASHLVATRRNGRDALPRAAAQLECWTWQAFLLSGKHTQCGREVPDAVLTRNVV